MNETIHQDYHPKFMLRAIELSEIAYKSGKGLPIGCVIVRNGKIIGEGHNEIFERVNPTSHGEWLPSKGLAGILIVFNYLTAKCANAN